MIVCYSYKCVIWLYVIHKSLLYDCRLFVKAGWLYTTSVLWRAGPRSSGLCSQLRVLLGLKMKR